jgi:hypothetical protein
MTERLWPYKDLERFLRYEDPEVRSWAADRLARQHEDEATDLLAPYLFDEHDVTPELVAMHLGRHGGAGHVPLLMRGVRSLQGVPAARSLEALIRLRAPEALERTRASFDRRDFDEDCWAFILDALADRSDPPARSALEEFLKRRADWYGSPAILRSALQVTGPGGYRPVLQSFIRSLQWRGAGSARSSRGDAGEAFRILLDHLQIDDCGWCFRTGLSGRIDFGRTLKAIESSYDCDLRGTLGQPICDRISSALAAGAYDQSAATLAEVIRQLASARVTAPGDDLADRIVEVASFWAEPEVARAVEGLGPHLREWVIGHLLSAVVKMARYRNYELEVRRSSGDLEALLALVEIETSSMVDTLPQAIAAAVESAARPARAGGPGEAPRAAAAGAPAMRSSARRMVEDRCLAILAARGPFFPQVMALEILGELRSVGAINEIMDFLSEDNSYLYEAAEHALSRMGEAVIEPARARLEAGNVDEEAGHSLLIALCESGTAPALKVVLDHFDLFVDAAGAAEAARWMSLFGARELIEPLRRCLKQDTALVGQALLLLGAIHNVRLPEEAAIRRAIDDYYQQHPDEEESGDPGVGDGSDKYLM